MALPRRLAPIRDIGEHLDERTGLWYHRSDLDHRVLGQADVPGQRARVEQNPLTRFDPYWHPRFEN
jgi:hypothetical protein